MSLPRSFSLLAAILGFLLLGLSARGATTLLPYNSAWYYFAAGYEPDSEWATSDYNDEDWPFGLAQFGYGDGDESTTVDFGSDDEHKYVTTYFRTYVNVSEPGQFAGITLNVIRDDGIIIYVNGVEVVRNNMPAGPVSYGTYALSGITYPQETEAVTFTISPTVFVDGMNLIAVELHQYEPASPDLSFDLQMIGENAGSAVVRGPYLQVGTSTNLIVRWRTDAPTDTRVRYGTAAENLNQVVFSTVQTTEHEIELTGLLPDTRYYYDVGTTGGPLAGDSSYTFRTAPLPGTRKPTRIWAIGDFGTGFPAQHNVRNAYMNFTANRHTDVWLMLGDNAYYYGFDDDYQNNCFDIYPQQFRQCVVWPTMGNHETGFGSQIYSDDYAYYRIFTMPTNAQAGGLPSGTEHYYSFDYANIHFVCLDSMTAAFRQPGSAMAQWLAADLADTTQDWIIVYFHHPPYTRGSHNSDFEWEHIQMRENITPILENYGVDLVLGGHSHSYERSYFLHGHYGYSSSFNTTHMVNNGNGRTNGSGPYVKVAGRDTRGAVYIVDGTSGGQGGGGLLNHPAMFYSTLTYGSLVIDVESNRLDATFVTAAGTVADYFTIVKETPPTLSIARAGQDAVITWPNSLLQYQVQGKSALADPEWTPVSGTVLNLPNRRGISIPATNSQHLFRLKNTP